MSVHHNFTNISPEKLYSCFDKSHCQMIYPHFSMYYSKFPYLIEFKYIADL